MGNTYFQFKQFTINQSKATLKVCTESCIFGAYIPVDKAKNVLDIGTGTGLLALMLAQRSTAQITAIELDTPSFEDAQDNFLHSPWQHRLHIENKNIKDITPHTNQTYDLIVCNPPFFIEQLKSPNDRINTALHGHDLKPADLFEIVNTLTMQEGRFYVLLPEREMNLLLDQFTKGDWQCIDILKIFQKENKAVFRIVAGFQKTSSIQEMKDTKLIIHEEDRTYSEDFCRLLKDYYLYL